MMASGTLVTGGEKGIPEPGNLVPEQVDAEFIAPAPSTEVKQYREAYGATKIYDKFQAAGSHAYKYSFDITAPGSQQVSTQSRRMDIGLFVSNLSRWGTQYEAYCVEEMFLVFTDPGNMLQKGGHLHVFYCSDPERRPSINMGRAGEYTAIRLHGRQLDSFGAGNDINYKFSVPVNKQKYMLAVSNFTDFARFCSPGNITIMTNYVHNRVDGVQDFGYLNCTVTARISFYCPTIIRNFGKTGSYEHLIFNFYTPADWTLLRIGNYFNALVAQSTSLDFAENEGKFQEGINQVYPISATVATIRIQDTENNIGITTEVAVSVFTVNKNSAESTLTITIDINKLSSISVQDPSLTDLQQFIYQPGHCYIVGDVPDSYELPVDPVVTVNN